MGPGTLLLQTTCFYCCFKPWNRIITTKNGEILYLSLLLKKIVTLDFQIFGSVAEGNTKKKFGLTMKSGTIGIIPSCE